MHELWLAIELVFCVVMITNYPQHLHTLLLLKYHNVILHCKPNEELTRQNLIYVHVSSQILGTTKRFSLFSMRR